MGNLPVFNVNLFENLFFSTRQQQCNDYHHAYNLQCHVIIIALW